MEIEAFSRAQNNHCISKVPQKNLFYISRCIPLLISRSPLIFTPVHNQTVLCPDPPYGLSTMMLACCCRGPIIYGRSEPGGRAAAARGGRRNTGPLPARDAPPWAAAPSGPWGTQVAQERRDHSPQTSSLSHSFWERGNVQEDEIIHCIRFIFQSEALRTGMALQGHLSY